MEDFEIYSFVGRDKAKEIIAKINELQDLLNSFGVYDTELSIDKLEEVLFESCLKFEKSKL